jgi:hypothetical protein
MMPSANELRRAGELVPGTGYGSTALLGLFLGALAGYIIRTVLDYSICRHQRMTIATGQPNVGCCCRARAKHCG